MIEIDKNNNNSSVSTFCDTVIKKFDDIIKVLNEIKDQATAVAKREKKNLCPQYLLCQLAIRMETSKASTRTLDSKS